MANQKVDIVVAAKDRASRQFRSIAKAALGMGAAFISWRAIKSVVAGSVQAYQQQEAAEQKLASALKATGNAAGFSFDQLKKYAAGLQKMTTYGDEAIMEMQSLMATFRNVQGDVFTEATMLTLDVSHAMGQDLKSSAIQLGKALNDPITGMSALSRVGITFSDQQKQQIKQFMSVNDLASAQKVILAELNNQFGGQATAAANTFGGAIKRLGNAWGDAKEQLGKMIAEIPGFTNVIDIAIGVLQNLKLSMDILWTSAGLVMVDFWENLKHYVSYGGDLIKWFGDNWKNILIDMFNFDKTVLKNMFENFKNFFLSVYSWLRGDGFDFKWTGLLEGFESTLSELPKIIERNKSALEIALEKEISTQIEQFNINLKRGITKPEHGENKEKKSFTTATSKGKVSAVESRFLGGAMAGIDYNKESATSNKRTARATERLVSVMEKILNEPDRSKRERMQARIFRMA